MSDILHHRGAKAAELPRFAAADYLESVLPSLLAGSTAQPPKAPTIIQLVVSDLDGCDYFYTISERGVVTTRGLSDQVDLTLSFLSSDLGDLSQNKLDVTRAVRTARLRVMGDEGVLGWLSKRLAV